MRVSCPHCRTCAFYNVCLNNTSQKILYFRDPADDAPLFYDFAGKAHQSFPKDFVNTGELGVQPAAEQGSPSCSKTWAQHHTAWCQPASALTPSALVCCTSSVWLQTLILPAYAAHVHIPPTALFWAPDVVKAPRPADAAFAPGPVAVLASLNDFASNFGHALFDFLFPVSPR